jgi:hypothetical protein
MTGAPRAAYSGGEFLIVRLDAVETLGSWEAAAIWHRIVWRSERDGSWTATAREIADEVKLSEYRTKVALRAIRDAGWITAERADPYDPTLCWAPVWADAETRPHVKLVSDVTLTEESDFTSLQDRNRTTPPPTPPADDELFTAPAALAAVPDPDPVDVAFEAWWSSYPRKVSKARARKAYAAAGRSAAARAAIAAGLEAQLAGLRARPMDKIPHPTTWLNQRRWEDEAEHAVPVPSVSSGGRRNYFAETALAGRGAELLASMTSTPPAIGASS